TCGVHGVWLTWVTSVGGYDTNWHSGNNLLLPTETLRHFAVLLMSKHSWNLCPAIGVRRR
ncbi:hypothetical protein MKX03_015074, partial [Papaver bracteatum]